MVDQVHSVTEPAAPPRNPWAPAFCLLGPAGLSIAFAVAAPLVAPLAHAFGGAPTAQKIVVAPQLGLAIGGLFAGWVIKQLGEKATIILSTAVFVAAGLAALFVQTAMLMLSSMYMLGAAAVILATAANVVLAGRYSGEARGRMIGFQTAVGGLSQSAAVLLSGFIAQQLGWRESYLVIIVIGAISLVVGLLAVQRGPDPAEAAEAAPRFDARLLLPVMPAYIAIAITLLVATTTYTHMSLLLSAAGITSASVSGDVIFLQPAACMVSAFAYGWLVSRFGRIPIAVIGVLTGALGMAAAGLAPSLVTFAASAIGLGITIGLLFPFLIDETMGAAAAEIRPQALGFLSTAQFIGGFANPYVVGPVTAALGLNHMYVAVGAAWLVLGLVGVLLRTGKTPQPAAG